LDALYWLGFSGLNFFAFMFKRFCLNQVADAGWQRGVLGFRFPYIMHTPADEPHLLSPRGVTDITLRAGEGAEN
ncbi:MAG: hypothetical protein WAL71_14195, partial [Terriglobales bacterium]